MWHSQNQRKEDCYNKEELGFEEIWLWLDTWEDCILQVWRDTDRAFHWHTTLSWYIASGRDKDLDLVCGTNTDSDLGLSIVDEDQGERIRSHRLEKQPGDKLNGY